MIDQRVCIRAAKYKMFWEGWGTFYNSHSFKLLKLILIPIRQDISNILLTQY